GVQTCALPIWGANAIIATASGEGDARPQSPELTDIRPGYPKIEYRWSPSSSIKEVSTLIEHASAKLDEISDGTRLLEIEARWDQPPVRLRSEERRVGKECAGW